MLSVMHHRQNSSEPTDISSLHSKFCSPISLTFILTLTPTHAYTSKLVSSWLRFFSSSPRFYIPYPSHSSYEHSNILWKILKLPFAQHPVISSYLRQNILITSSSLDPIYVPSLGQSRAKYGPQAVGDFWLFSMRLITRSSKISCHCIKYLVSV
jgi:hypothetical protein